MGGPPARAPACLPRVRGVARLGVGARAVGARDGEVRAGGQRVRHGHQLRAAGLQHGGGLLATGPRIAPKRAMHRHLRQD